MTIGITGSIGFLGANLVKYLCDRQSGNLDMVCFYSHRRSNPLTDHLDLSYRHLDITSRDEVLEKTRDLDVLFHLAGVVDYSRKQARRTWDANVLGAKNIFDAAIQNGIQKLIYISSINVLGTVGAGSQLADEYNRIYESPGNPISFRNRTAALTAVESSTRDDYGFLRRSRVPYFDSKLAAYELAADYHRRNGLPVITVLPGTAVGRGDVGVTISQLIYLVSMNQLKFALPGSSSFVSARDVAEGIWLSYLRGQVGHSYIITGRKEDNLEYRDFMKRIAKVAAAKYGRPVSDRFFCPPSALCYLLAGVLRILGIDSQPGEALILSGCANHRFSHKKARDELGYHPRDSIEEAIAACIDFYFHHLNNGET
ncbi:MAG: NAD-dependent epimerase/dehydratase family protein [Spirochaetaceae bacterium]|nr:MAG: NAD-dependent epimerase/dehydratase family protein [Spirochaetaceae bacterium]